MARVVLAMSGGVDSSVAAHLLLEQGHEVVGVFMRHGEESAAACAAPDGSPSPVLPGVDGLPGADGSSGADGLPGADGLSAESGLPVVNMSAALQTRSDHKQGCCSASDAADARRVSDRLGIPFYALNLNQDFRRIIDYFVDEYTHGRTPNPCVQCNNWIKFGRLFEYADSIDAQFVATGHYAQIQSQPGGELGLCRGVDDRKDQSYVLFGIRRALLQRMLLPVGQYEKAWIRQQAEAIGLRVANKPDSQEICFVTSGHHGEFVRSRTGGQSTAGQIVTTDGTVVGQHAGIEAFTIGQRKRLGVAMGEPYFVVRIDRTRCQVVIGRKEELACNGLVAAGVNWLIDPPSEAFTASLQIRYNSAPESATVTPQPDGRFSAVFDQPIDAIAPGQAAVIYRNNRVLGGGWIESSAI